MSTSVPIEYPPDADGVFRIYPGDGIPADSRDWNWQERALPVAARLSGETTTMVHNVVIPTLTMFRPDPAAATGASLIIAPGGAFRFLMMEHEGYDMARAVAAAGMTAFVLRYRLMHTPDDEAGMRAYVADLGKELPIQDRSEVRPPVGNAESEAARPWAEADGRQAVRWVRQQAQELGLDAHRIGIAGFSAGGGVAVSAAMLYDDATRPDFVAGIYPGYRRNLPVPSDAPPLFLAAADGDILVSPGSTAALYQAWHNAGRLVELHIFSEGAHGFGMYRGGPTEQWFGLFLRWLESLAILTRNDSGREHERMEGNETMTTRAPAQWAAEPFAYLTTSGRNTGTPHRIEIWFAVEDGAIYLLSGGRDRADWVRNLQANPNVSIEIGTDTFSGDARVIAPDDPDDRVARDLLVAKYHQGNDLEEWGRTSLPVVIKLPAGE